VIELREIAVKQGAFALAGVSLRVETGQHAVVMGPTGCGKTTLLEVVAGLRDPAAGTVWLNGVNVTAFDPARRAVGYVPQESAVFRTMTVRANLGFGRAIRGLDPDPTVADLATRLKLTHLLDRRAVGLSGGEAQRVALGRALAFGPSVLLLDEPFNAADEATRGDLLALVAGERQRRGLTVLHVTHDRSDGAAADVVYRDLFRRA
jgi:molybdate/tungstate transport system ATP-binding protein